MRRSIVVRSVAACVAALLPVLVFSCSDSGTAPKASVSDGCNLNSDCVDPLVCAFRRCHQACATTRDCPDPQRCVTSDRPFHVCQLPVETLCSFNSDCPSGQVCGIDGKCRDQCKTERDCLEQQICVTGTCADQTEVTDAGTLPVTNDAAADASGQPCTYTSECKAPFVCKNGLCATECKTDVDCTNAGQCVDSRCVVPYCGLRDGGLVVDGGGAFCLYDSECPPELVCRDNRCQCQCVDARDCAAGESCTGFHCVATAP